MRAAILWMMMAGAGLAQTAPDRAGVFDYYVLALSWQPTWCALEGDARDAPECDPRAGFTLHGLWPQFAAGWPEWCRTAAQDPSRSETARMADVMAPGLAWYQWQKHGRCTGLSSSAYFATARAALARVTLPPVLEGLDRDLSLPARVVEEAFLEANPDLAPDAITVTCKAGRIAEARICLTRDLAFRDCGADVRRDCSLTDALMDGTR